VSPPGKIADRLVPADTRWHRPPVPRVAAHSAAGGYTVEPMHLGWWDHMTLSDRLTLASIAAVLIVGVVVPVLIYRRQRSFTSVDYQIVADINLIESDAADAFGGRVKVMLNDRPLRHPRIVDVQVMNTGNTPVQASDYQSPIVFALDNGDPPLDATVIGESSPHITGNLFAQGDPPRTISIRPPLLNEDESFTLRMLFDNRDSHMIGTHRIVGGLPMREGVIGARSPQARFSRAAFAVWGLSAIVMVPIAARLAHNAAEGVIVFTAGLSPVMLITALAAFFVPRRDSTYPRIHDLRANT
jgi:hypothetical protein